MRVLSIIGLIILGCVLLALFIHLMLHPYDD